MAILKKILLSLAGILQVYFLSAQDLYKRQPLANVQAYDFHVTLNDSTNVIQGEALVTVDLKAEANSFSLDLIKKTGLYGMTVTGVFEQDQPVDYTFSNNRIVIPMSSGESKQRIFKIAYHGMAEKGLVISTTKFGQRSFFGDNWPNLARYWLPCVDHPYDKATVSFEVTAPECYDVVATGKKIQESNLGNGYKLTVYREPAPVATKVVTIGVTKFASTLLGSVDNIPVTAWVYPENRLEGFSDYAVAVDVLKYFTKEIGPFPWAKLANVQAKTQWGGLENAGTITYPERSVTGKNTYEQTIAHEIAHQWFGDSVTENSWNQVWLSEGFATYFAVLFQESVYGDEKRKAELEIDRQEIIDYFKENPSPVVDNTIKDPFKVLSVNTYQKGGWVLNMLRHKFGNETFWNGIRLYYKTYKDTNVSTTDFRTIMEKVSGQNLEHFFEEWIFNKGYPELQWDWTFSQGKLKLHINQLQTYYTFRFPVDIGIVQGNKMTLKTVQIDAAKNTFEMDLNSKPDAVILDPETWLLYEDKNK
ncbi:M1 family metallopeptidase [Gaetbulibacter aestuarii]|uniref:Aminopeptidase N n=1 Tax=Gaetbulibacter aestuarii TaxID=1502358 RepID=A0ABW7MVH9_9FLAO